MLLERLRGGRRAAGQTETILVVVGIAVALLIGTTIFGRKIASFFAKRTADLDAGTPASKPADGGEEDQFFGVPLVDPATIAIPAAIQESGIVFDPKFTPQQQAAFVAALAQLPKALQELAPKTLQFSTQKNVQVNTTRQFIIIGPFALDPNAPGAINDFFVKTTGIDPGFTVPRILFHEIVHVFHKQNSGIVDPLFSDFDSRKGKLESDEQFVVAQFAIEAVEAEIKKLAKKKGKEAFDQDGLPNPEVFGQILDENPDLKKDLQEAQREISARLEAFGFPSRFPGDDHAIKNPREAFAIAVEIAKFQPDKFREFREKANDSDPSNDVLSPELIQFIDDHPELLK